ncbi:MAG: PTS sugar transporter subunit IIA [Fusobacterium sp. JB021]|nr:PTS sugar transporter subunit IIA [Fusobacterium sp. JB020]MDP0493191.1 PTS sugar transporter subunit IIA [Fusobacterium sp. JB021]MDP0506103.1 PTS sugar transporter subunit IIA [Fusobacterium sp. JB019]
MVDIVKITDYMSEDLIKLDLESKTKENVLNELSELMIKSSNIKDKNIIKKALTEREELGSTGIGKGIAIPHAKTSGASKLTVAFGLSKHKIDFDSMDGEGVNIFFVFASPIEDSKIYLKVLARISRLIRSESFRNKLANCKDSASVIKYIEEEECI